MKIKVVNFQAIQSLTKAYYTSSWSGVAEAENLCYTGPGGTGCCGDKGIASCEDYYDNSNELNPCDQFSSSAITLPGKTGCVAYPGGWNTGCFYYVDMCQYYRAALAPRGEVILVNLPGLVTYEVTLDLDLTLPDGTLVSRRISTSVPTTGTDYYSAVLSGFFLDFGINWGSKKIGQKGASVKLLDAADPNVPNVGSIGDIQANTASDLTNPTLSSFTFANNIFGATPQSTGVSLTFQGSGGDLWTNFPSSPFNYSGFTWSWNNGLKATITRQLNSQITVSMTRDFSVYFSNDIVCPVAEYVKTEGCFNCPDGATISFRVKSSCRPGVCTVSLTNGTLYTTTVSLSSEFTTVNAIFATMQEIHSDTLVVTCQEKSTAFSFTSELLDWQSVYNRSNDTTLTPRGNNPSGFDFDLGNLLGVDDVAEVFVWIAIAVAAILIIGLVAFLIVKLVMSKKGLDTGTKSVFNVMLGRDHMSPSYERIEDSNKLKKDQLGGAREIDELDDRW
jgi:hypothetical protein